MNSKTEGIDPEREGHRQLWRSLRTAFIAPALVLVFFVAAPWWLNSRIRDAVENGISADTSLSATERTEDMAAISQMDFQKLSVTYPPHLRQLHEWLMESGNGAEFQRLHWALELSWLLAVMLVFGMAALLVLNRLARRSRADFVRYYRWGWHLAVFLAMGTALLLVPLLVYGLFEFSTLLADRYYPQVLLLLFVGGVAALWYSVKILLTRIPLEFGEALAREVTRSDSPEIWQVVQEAAEKLLTDAPDHIIVGMQQNFYVTELSVHHSSGQTKGKTLFLSYPLMKLLPAEEVVAIIGHELGHFIGEDTALSRAFYPLRHKVGGITTQFARGGLSVRPAFEVLNSFHWCFEGVAGRLSRERELEADQKGAELTSPRLQATALVRLHVALEAFDRGILRAPEIGEANPFDLSLSQMVNEKLVPEDDFWSELFHKRQSHPMDTHPSLQMRLAGLGQQISREEARTIALGEEPSSFEVWFGSRDGIFNDLEVEAKEVIRQIHYKSSLTTADIGTAEGRELLQEAFPEVTWRITPFRLWLPVAIGFLFLITLFAIAFFVPDPPIKIAFGGGCVVASLMFLSWKIHRKDELTVNAEGITYTGWKRPLSYQEILLISFNTNYSAISMNIRLKEGIRSPAKFALLLSREVALSIASFDERTDVICETVLRYMARELPA